MAPLKKAEIRKMQQVICESFVSGDTSFPLFHI